MSAGDGVLHQLGKVPRIELRSPQRVFAALAVDEKVLRAELRDYSAGYRTAHAARTVAACRPDVRSAG